ncbi:MAG: ATP-dependent helicase [Candidatus Woesearchaeota archaeon]
MIEVMQKSYEKETINIMHPLFKKWFFTKFKDFSEPQKYSIYNIHIRENTLITAPTGSGKTLSAFGAVLNELIDNEEKGILKDRVYCVYISPLKALSNDISRNLKEPLQEMEEIARRKINIRIGVRTGDTTVKEKTEMLKNAPHILITTPESLAILLTSPKFIDKLKEVQWCIVDEVHALAENKRGVHLSLSLEKLQLFSPAMCRIGLSATIAPLEEVAKFLVGFEKGKERNCKIIDVQFIKQLDLKVISPVESMIEGDYEVRHNQMYEVINELVQQHMTTLIFTNTRSATERVVHYLKEKFPKNYTENIGAHHGSLSKEHRHDIENRLKEGKLKVVVSSTSLELGIDIGYIDLVILLGSPKSVARCLQRIGRSGHQLHATAKGRIIVLDRDDLVECAVLLKSALERKIDKIHIPKNCLDVLAQQINGFAISEKINIDELFKIIRQSYCYKDLSHSDFIEVIDYLAGKYVSLQDRHVYAKIWHDEATGMIGRHGKMGRVIYMTNIGTIPDETYITVKVGNSAVGKIDEGFLERLKRGDVFVLGGETYEFKFSRGMVAQVQVSVDRPPTVPSWVSEMLPLSFDLALEIGRFRRLMEEKFSSKKKKDEILKFIDEYFYVDKRAANAIYEYFYEQFHFAKISTDKKIVIENYRDRKVNYYIFHTLYGRRVNDCLSRAIGFAIGRLEHVDVEIGITDNGFYIGSKKVLNVKKALKAINAKNFHEVVEQSLENTEVLKRRFRHCATRALMILRNYKGHQKRVGRQQVSSMLLLSAVKRISSNFCILKEAKREVLEDLMDETSALTIVDELEKEKIKIEEFFTEIPSPFAFNIVLQGYSDIVRVEDKFAFLQKMHNLVMAKIALKESKSGEKKEEAFNYHTEWNKISQ